jgi:hypothetical protein
MAFNFFGTFTTGQWEELKNFTEIQQVDLYQRKLWISRELARAGVFVTQYDGNTPVAFAAVSGSYADKLLQAYRILGGVPERDMLLRTSDQPVFAVRGAPLTVDTNSEVGGGYADSYSNGRRDRGSQAFDRDLGLLVDQLKSWQREAIKLKREHLEFKIKRALDYADQLQQESNFIDLLMGVGLGNVSDQITNVEIGMVTPDAANVVDNTGDIYGLDIGTPSDLTRPSDIVDEEADAER